jgi:hypothetical protein
VTPVALAGQQLQSLKRYFNVLMNSLETTAKLQSDGVLLSSQHPGCVNSIIDAWGCSKACAVWVPQGLTNYHITPVTKVMVEAL